MTTTTPIPAHLLGSIYVTQNGIFCVDPRDQFVAKALIEQSSYGLHELARLNQFLDTQSSVLMLGPHIGALAVPLSKNIKELVVVEANPDTHRLLLINVLLNACNNINVFHAAANHEDGQIEFVMNTANSGGSKRMPLHKDQAYFYDDPQVQTVPAARLDDLLNGHTFDLIFMDIEGSEYFAMKGMPRLLSACKFLVTEFIPHHLDRVGGITVSDFLEPLQDFQSLFIPSISLLVQSENFLAALTQMCEQGIGDEGLIFFKEKMLASADLSTFVPAHT
jgi:FkbM family methyltransferase